MRSWVLFAVLVVGHAAHAASLPCERIAPPSTSIRASFTQPFAVLKEYLDARLDSADWSTFSRYITWTDEPGWDEHQPVAGYRIGHPRNRNGRIYVPVKFATLGIWYSTPEYKPHVRLETVIYELINTGSGYRVNRPDDLLPHQCASTFDDSLTEILRSGTLYDVPLTTEQRRNFDVMLKQLRTATSQGQALLRSHRTK